MPTLTTNFQFIKPNVNDPIDQNNWGYQLNTDLDSLDSLLELLATTAIGTSRPSYVKSGTQWINNSNSSLWDLYVYDGINDVLMGTINPVSHVFTPANGGLLTNKGDLLTSDGTQNAKLSVGTNGQVLVANSAQTVGLQWDAVSSHLGAWVTFQSNITGTTIYGSNNVSSITRSSAGVYQISFTNPLPSANYAVFINAQRATNGGGTAIYSYITYNVPPTANYCSVTNSNYNNLNEDPNLVCVVCIGG